MNPYLDRDHDGYRWRWQAVFGCRGKSFGPAAALEAQSYISILRVMRRRLLAGGKPRILDFPPYRKVRPEDFLLNRSSQRLRRACDRGEAMQTIRRRGLFDPLGQHQVYRTFGKKKAYPPRA